MKLRHYVYSPDLGLERLGTGAQQAAAFKLAQEGAARGRDGDAPSEQQGRRARELPAWWGEQFP